MFDLYQQKHPFLFFFRFLVLFCFPFFLVGSAWLQSIQLISLSFFFLHSFFLFLFSIPFFFPFILCLPSTRSSFFFLFPSFHSPFISVSFFFFPFLLLLSFFHLHVVPLLCTYPILYFSLSSSRSFFHKSLCHLSLNVQ